MRQMSKILLEPFHLNNLTTSKSTLGCQQQWLVTLLALLFLLIVLLCPCLVCAVLIFEHILCRLPSVNVDCFLYYHIMHQMAPGIAEVFSSGWI